MFILVHVPIWKKYNLSQFADFIFLDMYFFEHFLILETEFIIVPGNPKQILRPPDNKTPKILYN